MANIKRVKIEGWIPYHAGTEKNDDLLKFLGQFNLPAFGLRIRYGREVFQRNQFGGETAMYQFEIHGQEAVRIEWINKLRNAIEDAGGYLDSGEAWDIEVDPNEPVWKIVPKDKPVWYVAA